MRGMLGLLSMPQARVSKALNCPSQDPNSVTTQTVGYRSLKKPDKILLGMFAVKGERITMQDPSFLKLIETLGEIPESKQLLIMTPLPPPPVDNLADNATPNAPPVKVKTIKAYGGGVTIMKSYM